MRRLARACLTLCLVGSCAMTGLAAVDIARSPAFVLLAARSAAEIVTITDRIMAAEATPQRLADLVARRLAEDPRNWVALTALRDEATARGIALPPDLVTAYDAALSHDTGPAALAADCAACLWDIAACTLSNVMICKAPILLTPIEDLRGIARAGWNATQGNAIDRLDLGLSVAGLGATALVVASGGGSATVKAGATLARVARGMDLVSPRLAATATDALRAGVDWPALAKVTAPDDIARVIRADALAPVVALAGDLGRMTTDIGPTATLHLLRAIDTPAQAARLADAAAALGPRTVARAEVLGPARLMRATVRLSRPAWLLIGGLTGLLLGAAGLLGGLVQGAALRGLRRLLRG